MTFKQLEAFYWAATLHSFSVAAARLHVTQSTLSKRVAELESDLGKALFDRSGQRAILTDAGERLLAHAAQMLDIEGRIRADLDVSGPVRGTCRLGISELVAATWFPEFVSRVNRRYPHLALEPQVDLTLALEKRLERGDLDFAVIPGPSEHPALAQEKIGELEYRWMASPQRLPKGTVLHRRHLAEHPVITLNPQSRLSRTFDEWARQQGIQVPRALVCNSLSALIALTIAGVGISYFPRIHVQPYVRAGKLVELVSRPRLATLSYYVQWRKDDRRAMIAALKDIVLSTADFSASPLLADMGR